MFLSYVKHEADRVGPFKEAIVSAGFAWYDPWASGEHLHDFLLVGDSWDAELRTDIGDCGLFMPFISRESAFTPEGLHHAEWNLALQWSKLMAPSVPFLMPVLIDEIDPDTAVHVPRAFLGKDWVRCVSGMPTKEFRTSLTAAMQKVRDAWAKP